MPIESDRADVNADMARADIFFARFGDLDAAAYAEGAIPRKHKELIGLALSVATRCRECVDYHLDGAIAAGATRPEMVEAVKLAVVGAGSITYPTARHAFRGLRERGFPG